MSLVESYVILWNYARAMRYYNIPHLFFRQSWTNVLGHFCISGAFSDSHKSNPSPHATNNVGRVSPEFFFEFQLCIGWVVGELGELGEIFEKDAPF